MKKGYKRLAIIGGVLLLVGIFFTAIGLALGGHHRLSIGPSGIVVGSGDFFEKMQEFTNIQNLTLDVQAANINFIESDTYRIEYGYHETDQITLNEKDGHVTITGKHQNRFWLFHFSWFRSTETTNYINIYYPKDSHFEKIEITSDVGEIAFDHTNIDTLTLNSDIGSVTIKNTYIGSADFDLDLGSLEMNDSTLNHTDIDLQLGSLEMLHTISSDLDVSLSMGDATIIGTLYGTHEIDCSMGDVDITIEGSEENYRYELSTSLGSTFINQESVSNHTSKKDGQYFIKITNSMGDSSLNFNY